MSLILDLGEIKKTLKDKKFLIFDFDGVLVDSVAIKGDVFAEIYDSYGKKISDLVRNHHFSNGGMSRYEKFCYYHKNYLNLALSEAELNKLCDYFSSLVKAKVIDANEILGANDFLKNVNVEGKFCFINSATPVNELREIVHQRRCGHYFIELYGSPSSKIDNLKEILNSYSKDPKDFIFFGDALSDFIAAKECSIDFVGVGQGIMNILDTEKGSWLVIENFKGITNGA